MITAVCSMFSVHSPNTRRQDVFVLSSLGPKYFREIRWLFPFQRILDPLELRSTNVVETFLKNLNGPECCHLTSAGTGKNKREGECSCFVEVFPLSCHCDQIWIGVWSQMTTFDEHLMPLRYFLGLGRGDRLICPKMREYSKAKT